MQADLPSMPQPTDFVQQIDFASLVEKPDLAQAKLLSIPEGDRRSRAMEGLGKVFNLADLDRIPEALFQPPPVFPAALKHDVSSASVTVEFVVDTNGVVVNAYVTDTSHVGFNVAATTGVSRWKFRPGMRGGRKVNTRMRVPINFKLIE